MLFWSPFKLPPISCPTGLNALSECDHHWTHLNVLERTLSAHECLWVSIECAWVHSNLREFLWVSIGHSWMHLSAREAFEWVWMQLNALSLLIPIWKWVCMKAFERVWMWLNMPEHTLSVWECLWARIEDTWTRLNVLWVHVNAIEWVLNATECAWMPLSRYWTYVSAHL